MRNIILLLLLAPITAFSQVTMTRPATLESAQVPQRTMLKPDINFDLLGMGSSTPKESEESRRWLENHLDGKLQPLAPTAPPKRVYDFQRQLIDRLLEKSYGVGTGTRGGGSGVATIEGATLKVEVLDLYRSHNREKSPLFLNVDPQIATFDQAADAEAESEKVLEKVLARLDTTVPLLAGAIKKAQREMPFRTWTAADTAVPLIDDYIGTLSLQPNQKQVQIAYRRANRIIYVRSLYEAMDPLNRAGLKLHEYIYAVSGKEKSVQIQRFVSLAFSEQSRAVTFAQEAVKLLTELGLENLARKEMKLPQTASLGYAKLSRGDVCGRLEALDLNPADKSVDITVSYDPSRPHTLRKDIDQDRKENPYRSYDRILSMNRRARVHLKTDQLIQVMVALYVAKGQLQINWPIYQYPGQSWPSDLFCVNERKNQVLQFEGSLEVHPGIRQRDLKLAELEANYYRAHSVLDGSPGTFSAFMKIQSDLAGMKAEQAIEETRSFVDLFPEAETLENIVVKFQLSK